MAVDMIGAETFIRLDGGVGVKGLTMDDITRKGVDGSAYKKMGIRGKVYQLVGIRDYTSAAAADAAYDTYRNMIGTTVTVKINTIDRTNQLILDVDPIRLPEVISAVGGITGGNHLVQSVWTLQYGYI